jgi:hypothetical protein
MPFMQRQTYVVVLNVLILLLIALCSQAQDTDHSRKHSDNAPDATPGKITKGVLNASGFAFADQPRPMCKISGPEGPCRVEAFVFGEKTTDEARYTCSKLDRATYVGHCVKGKLDGLSLVIADGSKKLTKEAYMSYFNEGRIAYPALSSFLAGDTNFGVTEKGRSYGCVYFGKWDKSTERCALFMEIYGKDLFTESNAQKLRDGNFDLDNYRVKFLEFMQRKHEGTEKPHAISIDRC